MTSVSIILSVYNGANWLDKAILSIQNQSFQDFEFLIINDGSNDSSLDIANKYAAKDSRLKIFTKENTGLPNSLNFGLSKAHGEWIARIDADDFSLPCRLTEQMMITQKDSNVILVGTNFYIHENGKKIFKSNLPNNRNKLLYRLSNMKGFSPADLEALI